MRLTRDMTESGVAAHDSSKYQEVGEQVHHDLAFTYFYPALRLENTYQISWPWEEEYIFRYRFLSSYAGTALSYPQQSAATGMLWETEFISPNTRDTGESVFLIGYIFEKEGCNLPWQKAIQRLQLGGERGYGWGRVELIKISESKDNSLFGQETKFQEHKGKPSVYLPDSARLLAHAKADGLAASGEVEPLVGREWRSDQKYNCYAGQHIEFNEICFVPGSLLNSDTYFLIDKFGIWTKMDK